MTSDKFTKTQNLAFKERPQSSGERVFSTSPPALNSGTTTTASCCLAGQAGDAQRHPAGLIHGCPNTIPLSRTALSWRMSNRYILYVVIIVSFNIVQLPSAKLSLWLVDFSCNFVQISIREHLAEKILLSDVMFRESPIINFALFATLTNLLFKNIIIFCWWSSWRRVVILNDLTIDITFRKMNPKFISIQYKQLWIITTWRRVVIPNDLTSPLEI